MQLKVFREDAKTLGKTDMQTVEWTRSIIYNSCSESYASLTYALRLLGELIPVDHYDSWKHKS